VVLQPIRSILNVYLEWLENAGVVGAAPMFLCIGWLILATFRRTLRRSRMVRALAGLIAVDAVFLIHGATDFGLEVTSIAALWSWLLGLQFSLAQGSSKR
jgi:O-antigen ligase